MKKEKQDGERRFAFSRFYLLTVKKPRNMEWFQSTPTVFGKHQLELEVHVVVKQDNDYYTWNLKHTTFIKYWFYMVKISKSSQKKFWSGYFPVTVTSSSMPLILCNTESCSALCHLRKVEGHFLFYGSHSGSITILLSQEYSILQSCERKRNKAHKHWADSEVHITEVI